MTDQGTLPSQPQHGRNARRRDGLVAVTIVVVGVVVVAAIALSAVLLWAAAREQPNAPVSRTSNQRPTTTEAEPVPSGRERLVICTDAPYVPMEMEATEQTTPSGYTGFDIDLAQAMADGIGAELVVRLTPFNGIFAAMDAGVCDAVVSAVTITDGREANMDFSDPYFEAGQSVIVTTANEATYTTLADLAGKKIGVQSGTTGEEYVNSNLPDGATVVALPGSTDLFASLEAGTIDAVVQDYAINAYQTTQDPNFVVTEKIFIGEQYGMAVRTGDIQTLELLNQGLQVARSDGTYNELHEKYFGEAPPS